MSEKKTGAAELVREAAAPVAQSMGLILWDVLFVKEGPSWFLRIIIDKDGGVSIDDCERLSRALDPIIDELDPTELEYYLEVSSPGLGRTLRTDAHLAAYTGKDVAVKLYAPCEAGRELKGTLEGFDSESLTVSAEGSQIRIDRKNVAAVKADDDDI